MQRTNSHRHHRKPDIMVVLVVLVGLALTLSLALQFHLLATGAGSAWSGLFH